MKCPGLGRGEVCQSERVGGVGWRSQEATGIRDVPRA